MPWTKVQIDGRHRGTTPLLRLKLRAGRHKMVLTNTAHNIRHTAVFTIRAGKTTTYVRRFK